MLFILLACIYISFISLSWGRVTYDFITKISSINVKSPHVSILCLLGLVSILLFSQLFSLFIPLGSWLLQLLLFIPVAILLFNKSTHPVLKNIKNDFPIKNPVLLLLSTVSILLLLLMSSWKIIHPDTLGYHTQIIQWIEKYKAVPGIVHLHARFGFQSAWFAANALFNFNFFDLSTITILNTTVLIWFVFFITFKIEENRHFSQKYVQGIFLLFLLGSCFWSYTQIRLTATSASPDFITTIFIWISLILFSEKIAGNQKISTLHLMLASIFSIAAVIIKLSAIPILILPVICTFYFLKEKKTKSIILLVIIFFFAFIPFLARNIITSGYPIYPSTTLNIAYADWKYDKEQVLLQKNYITSYARTYSGVSKEQIAHINSMPVSEWIPVWWKNQSIADKTILILLLVNFVFMLFNIKKILAASLFVIIALITTLAGIVFWFIHAPDPRFGFGFIVGFIIIVCRFFLPFYRFHPPSVVLNSLTLVFLLLISTYTVYRFTNFYKTEQWLTPLGIEKSSYSIFECNGMKINSPLQGIDFGRIPVPCTDLKCSDFVLRSKNISDGFKAK